MTVVEELNIISDTRVAYVSTAIDLIGDVAEYAQQVARSNARRRSGELASSIEIDEGRAGLEQTVGAKAAHAVYNEFGTGIYAEGVSRAQEIPWVYYDEYLGQFFTTYGLEPQPFMRPAYEDAKSWLYANADRYFG